jgi:hypothetical protein
MNIQNNSLQRVAIEQIDIDTMYSGWLTDACIREIIARHLPTHSTRVNVVDPNRFNE